MTPERVAGLRGRREDHHYDIQGVVRAMLFDLLGEVERLRTQLNQ